MSYNRTFAKARAVARTEDRKVMLLPNGHSFGTWGAPMPPYSPRCRCCGVRTISTATKCPICGSAL